MKWMTALLIGLLSSGKILAQPGPAWISDASFDTPAKTFYSLCRDNKPVLIAVGNMHTQASEKLLQSGTLQKLARDHGTVKSGFSTDDLNVAFVNVTVFEHDAQTKTPDGIPVYNLSETSPILNTDGWNSLYSIHGTGLFLLTTDHLIYRLPTGDADALYAAIRMRMSRIHPDASPDVRLLQVRRDKEEPAALMSVQNFSTNPTGAVTVTIRNEADGSLIARELFTVPVAPLDAMQIKIALPQNVRLDKVSVSATVVGDSNPTNNVWDGSLSPVIEPIVAANNE